MSSSCFVLFWNMLLSTMLPGSEVLEFFVEDLICRADDQRQKREKAVKSELELCIIKTGVEKPVELNCSTIVEHKR